MLKIKMPKNESHHPKKISEMSTTSVSWLPLCPKLDKGIRGRLLVGGIIYRVPVFPPIQISEKDDWKFKGPVFQELYGSFEVRERGKHLIQATLQKNPRYFDLLALKIKHMGARAIIDIQENKKKRKLAEVI